MAPAKPLILIALPAALFACSNEDDRQRQQASALDARSAQLEKELRAHNAQGDTAETGLLVQLAFGAEADLDLYVTDPLLETVYFANKESKSGGRISEDRRCDSPALRIEEVRFDVPLGGRYRIGVDYPSRCDDAPEEFERRAAYSLSIMHEGQRQEINGSVGYHFFEVAAFDFEIDTSSK